MSEVKYSKEDGRRHVWVFHHSSCHAEMADNALDVSKKNVKLGGKQNEKHNRLGRYKKCITLMKKEKSCKRDEDGA